MKTIKKFFPVIFAVVLGIGLTLGDIIWVNAQESGADEFTLEEITVTAQKREENLQKVPITMEVVSGDDIKELGYNNLDEILSTLAGVFINTTADGFRVSLRGISDDIRATGSTGDYTMSTPSVAVNMDGVYTQGRNSGAGLYDIERVEVLYGPQSTLYSSASPGGIVNVMTADPKTDRYEASGSIKYGNYNTLQTQGAVNVPINDSFALRAAFNTSVHDGYMANGASDEDIKSARLKALINPTESLSFVVAAELTKTGGLGFSSINAFVSQDDLDDPWDNSDSDSPPPRYSDRKKISGDFNWDMGFAELSLVPAYNKEDAHATMTRTGPPPDFETYTNHMKRNGTEKGVELRVASPSDSSIEWIVGGNYYRLETKLHEIPEGGGNETTRWVTETTDAVFGNITYPVTDVFRISGGLRKTKDINDLYSLEYHPERISTGDPWDHMHCHIPYEGTDHRIGLEYDVSADSMLYANWSSGYRPVGMAIQPYLEPEHLFAYTLGMKNRFFENKLQLNATAFYYDYKDYVAEFGRVADPDDFNRNAQGATTNADLTYYGLELQTSTILSSNDKLDFSVAYLNSEFTRLIFDFENPKFDDQDFTGKPETFTPEWTIDLNYSHNFSLPNGGVLTARIDSRYQSDYLVSFVDLYQDSIGEGPDATYLYTFSSRAPYVTQDAHHISNFSLIYANPDGKWTLTGYVKNIENYAEKKSMMMNSIMIGSPRTFGAVLSIRY